ncbi:MAG: hypothetical protein GY845_29245 [Planctomycetes bacterium]|nr:hypothetical protein [Planctomycetota bacterium]
MITATKPQSHTINYDQPLKPRYENHDCDRDEAIKLGFEAMLEAASSFTPERVADRIRRLVGGYDRCMKDAYSQVFEHKCGKTSAQWTYLPCHEPGCEYCSWQNAINHLNKWSPSFLSNYERNRLMIIKFTAENAGHQDIRKRISRMMKSRPVQRSLRNTIGYIVATPDGYSLQQIIRFGALVGFADVKRIWLEIAGEGADAEFVLVDHQATAQELAAELRCQSEQAIPLLVDANAIDPSRGLELVGEELEVNRIVFGPGFRQATKEAELMKMALDRNDDAEFSAKVEEAIALVENSSNSIGDADSTEPQGENMDCLSDSTGPFITETEWEPCRVCGDPECGQRPIHHLPLIPFWKIKKLKKQGILRETDRKDVLLVVRREEMLQSISK